MGRKNTILLITLAALAALTAVLIAQPREALALQAHVDKVKSDCVSVQFGITLIHRTEDNDDGQDRFRMYLYENEPWHDNDNGRLTVIDEGIVAEQSPFYWVTNRIEAPTYRGRFTVELWDLDKNGNPVELLDQVNYDCGNEVAWRGISADGPASLNTLAPNPNTENTRELPYGTCTVRMPVNTTNVAPESGAVIITWSAGPDRDAAEFHYKTREVEEGFYFNGDIADHSLFSVPCGVYIRMYFQPDSTKLVYQMPSQYWPNSSYGAGTDANVDGAVFHTVFPLNGPQRTDPDAPPTYPPRPATATPIPSETPTADAEGDS